MKNKEEIIQETKNLLADAEDFANSGIYELPVQLRTNQLMFTNGKIHAYEEILAKLNEA